MEDNFYFGLLLGLVYGILIGIQLGVIGLQSGVIKVV